MQKKKPEVRVKQFDPSAFVIKANAEMFLTNRQDWIPGWFETKEQSLLMAEKHLQELVDLKARRCPTWHRVLAGMFVYYPLFKWRRAFMTWFWRRLIVPFFLLVTFPLRWSFNKLMEWLKDNGELIDKGTSYIPQILKLLFMGFGGFAVLFGLWIALDYGYHREVAQGAKHIATAVVIQAPLNLKESVVEWQSERVRKQTQAELQIEQERSAAQRYKKWERENPIDAAQRRAEQERINVELEQERLQKEKMERQETEYKWKRRALGALEVLKVIGILILGCIAFLLAVGGFVIILWLLAQTIKPLQRFFNAVYEITLLLIALFFIGFEKYTPTFYRWTDRSIVFVFVEFPVLVRKGVSFAKYAWDWAWGRICPALSVNGAQDMLQDVQSQLAQLRAQKAEAQQTTPPQE